jgi:hypothetical protein
MQVNQGVAMPDRQDAARESAALPEIFEDVVDLLQTVRPENCGLGIWVDERSRPAANRKKSNESQAETGKRTP